MAKGTAMGLWKGKKGSSVFYRIKNSNNAQKQGIRERVYDPANPRTSSQAGQRMKLLPAQRVYGMLKPIIERSWQGIPYGNTARYEFLRQALSETTTMWPALNKNSSETVPGGYQISKGTLPTLAARIDGTGALVCENITTAPDNYTMPLAEAYQQILDNNPNIQQGDQLTIVMCVSNANGEGFIWLWKSFIVNPDDSNNQGKTWQDLYIDLQTKYGLYIGISGESDYFTIGTNNPLIYAGAIIQSRDADTPLRSTERLSVDVAELPDYFSASGRTAARASYMNPERRYARDWPVEETDQETEELFETNYVVSGLTGNLLPFNGVQVKIWADAENNPKVVAVKHSESAADGTEIKSGLCVVDADNNIITKSIETSDGVAQNAGLLYSAVPFLASLRTQIVGGGSAAQISTDHGTDPIEEGTGPAIIEDQP